MITRKDLQATAPNAPERIHGWQNTQLSLAKHYGGCTYNGASYIIAENEDGKPLVRMDIFTAEAKAKAKAAKDARVLENEKAKATQCGFIEP